MAGRKEEDENILTKNTFNNTTTEGDTMEGVVTIEEEEEEEAEEREREEGGGGEEEERGGEEEGKGSGLRLPISRIKKIMKADPDLNLASQDAVFIVTKATVGWVEFTLTLDLIRR